MYGKFPFSAAIYYHYNGKAYFFNGSRYSRYKVGQGVTGEYPRNIKGHWNGWPEEFCNGIDAATFWSPNRKAYFFKGDKYIRHTPGTGMDAGYPKSISGNWTGWPADFCTGIDAAMYYHTYNKAFFFKGDKYIRFTPDTGSGESVDAGYPKPIKDNWAGLPAEFNSGIDAAIFWAPKDKVYFFKGDKYCRYTPTVGMDAGYPRDIAAGWRTMGGKYLTLNEVKDIIKKQVVDAGKTHANFKDYYGDSSYYCPPTADVQALLTKSRTDALTWTRSIFDCDDFAFVLKGEVARDNYRNLSRRLPYCFGIVWGYNLGGGHHAMNWVITDDLKFKLVEPQNDSIRIPGANDDDIYMIIC